MGRHYAHRGLHDNRSKAPENSLEAFRLAVVNGYGIELDVQITKDLVPVVFHDYDLKRTCGVDKRFVIWIMKNYANTSCSNRRKRFLH